MEGEKYYPGSTISHLEPFGGLKSIHNGHGNICDENVGIQGQNRVDCLITIFCCADDLKFLAKYSVNLRDHGLMIIGEHYSNPGHARPH